MSFDKKGFSPAHINAGPLAPRIFTYYHKDDLLSEIIGPGYFNERKLFLRPNSFIKVICKNAIAEIVVEKNTGDVTIKDEILRATDPYVELKKHGHPRPKPGKPRKPRKTNESLAKTG